MKRTLALALVLATAAAHADDFHLTEMTVKPMGKNAVGEKLVEVSGTCGAAKVRFSNVRQREHGLAADETATLTVQAAKRRLLSGAGGTLVLDAANELACVATSKGPRLVLAAWCMSTQCPSVNYQVVDTASMRQVTKFDVELACDKACAEKALGAKLPKGLLSY
jgi:hypothetical protein